jgi:hypothetical protein
MRGDSERRSGAELSGYTLQTYFDEYVFPCLELDSEGQPRFPLLIIDQFEELFVDPLDADQKREFLVELGGLLRKDDQAKLGNVPSPEIWALFSIREDRLADLLLRPDGDDFGRSIGRVDDAVWTGSRIVERIASLQLVDGAVDHVPDLQGEQLVGFGGRDAVPVAAGALNP